MGLSNSGKTSILQYLQGERSIPTFTEIKPTLQIQRVLYQAMEQDHTLWDFGGQENYLEEYLERFNEYLSGADKLIFTIDIQDQAKYKPSLIYFEKILNLLIENNYNLDVRVYLHKYDPDLKRTHPEITEQVITELIKRFKAIISKNVKVLISKTTIYAKFKEIPA